MNYLDQLFPCNDLNHDVKYLILSWCTDSILSILSMIIHKKANSVLNENYITSLLQKILSKIVQRHYIVNQLNGTHGEYTCTDDLDNLVNITTSKNTIIPFKICHLENCDIKHYHYVPTSKKNEGGAAQRIASKNKKMEMLLCKEKPCSTKLHYHCDSNLHEIKGVLYDDPNNEMTEKEVYSLNNPLPTTPSDLWNDIITHSDNSNLLKGYTLVELIAPGNPSPKLERFIEAVLKKIKNGKKLTKSDLIDRLKLGSGRQSHDLFSPDSDEDSIKQDINPNYRHTLSRKISKEPILKPPTTKKKKKNKEKEKNDFSDLASDLSSTETSVIVYNNSKNLDITAVSNLKPVGETEIDDAIMESSEEELDAQETTLNGVTRKIWNTVPDNLPIQITEDIVDFLITKRLYVSGQYDPIADRNWDDLLGNLYEYMFVTTKTFNVGDMGLSMPSQIDVVSMEKSKYNTLGWFLSGFSTHTTLTRHKTINLSYNIFKSYYDGFIYRDLQESLLREVGAYDVANFQIGTAWTYSMSLILQKVRTIDKTYLQSQHLRYTYNTVISVYNLLLLGHVQKVISCPGESMSLMKS
jgi:hypothetical protein